jgi:outer membrane protein assembly factor BamB
MARRRDSPLVFEIDTGAGGSGSDGSDDVGASGEAEPPRPSWFARRVAAPARERWRSVPRRTRVAVVGGGLAVAVLGTGAAVALDVRADAEHAARMATMHGGVIDLSAPLEQTWEVAAGTGVVAVLDGGLLVAQDGTEVLAVAAETGEVVWRHDLGEQLVCGSYVGWGRPDLLRTQREVTCLAGSPERTVTVIAADGEVAGQRVLDVAAPADTYELQRVGTITVDGSVAVADVVDLELTSADPETALAELEALRADGTWRDPVLRVEDALTGEVRGEAEIVLSTAQDLAECLNYGGTEAGAPWLSPSVYADPWSGGTTLWLCGKEVWVASDGTSSGGAVDNQMVVDGRRVTMSEEGSRVVAPDGSEFSVPGYVLEIVVDDDEGGPLVAATADGTSAFGPDGAELWTVDGEQAVVVLLRVGGVFVAQTAGGEVVALDAGTGERLWRSDELFGSVNTFTEAGALTDGRTGVLVVRAEAGPTRLVAFDLRDGSVRWEDELEQLGAQPFAVDGHVVVAVDQWSGSATAGTSGLRGYAVE